MFSDAIQNTGVEIFKQCLEECCFRMMLHEKGLRPWFALFHRFSTGVSCASATVALVAHATMSVEKRDRVIISLPSGQLSSFAEKSLMN